MKKIKVLQFPIANSYGGITHYALNNWKWIDKERFQFDFATMSKRLDFADEILETGSKIHYISCYAEENEQQFIDEINRILDEEYDIVHLHTKQWKSFLVEKLCLERKVPRIIVHSHSTRCDANDPVKREWETKEHNRVKKEFDESLATDFWACSEEAAEWLFGEQIAKSKIRILNNAIDVDGFLYNEKLREKIRKELDIEKYFVVGNVGRMVYQKNQEFLLEAFAEAYRSNPNLLLLFVGDGELKSNLEQQAIQLEIEKNVRFLGTRTDVSALYQAMDLFALPSRFEGLPITLIEAQASGLRCLCSDVITRSANVTENVEYLELDTEVWKKNILKNMRKNERSGANSLVRQSGYSLQSQIKNIEKLYAGDRE